MVRPGGHKRRGNAAVGGSDAAPPHDLGIEKELLGCLLMWLGEGGPDTQARKALAYLHERDFYATTHQSLFRGFRLALSRGVPIGDMAAFRRLLVDEGLLLSGENDRSLDKMHVADLAECIQRATLPVHLSYYCKMLRRLRGQRAAVKLAETYIVKSKTLGPEEWCEFVVETAGELLRRWEKSRKLVTENKGGSDAGAGKEER